MWFHRHDRAGREVRTVLGKHFNGSRSLNLSAESNETDDAVMWQLTDHREFSEILIERNDYL